MLSICPISGDVSLGHRAGFSTGMSLPSPRHHPSLLRGALCRHPLSPPPLPTVGVSVDGGSSWKELFTLASAIWWFPISITPSPFVNWDSERKNCPFPLAHTPPPLYIYFIMDSQLFILWVIVRYELYCPRFGHWKSLQLAQFLLTLACHVGRMSLLFGPTGYPKLISSFPSLSPGINHFSV